MGNRHFGEIEGLDQGATFVNRRALHEAGVHRPTIAGISGTPEAGADSIVLSGGYEDDEDYGDLIIYTGHGGRDPNTGQQIGDQTFTKQNAALGRSKLLGLPVRVVRGYELDSPFAPRQGYRYDGLYAVDEYWEETGRARFRVWRFKLRKIDGFAMPPSRPGTEPPKVPDRRAITTTRILRDSEMSRRIKRLYDYTCQICGVRLDTPAGPYAEGAHIKPLGVPHNGPDIEANLICLCPNHHVLFDDGALALADDLSVLGLKSTKLTVKHTIEIEYVQYHREHFGVLIKPKL